MVSIRPIRTDMSQLPWHAFTIYPDVREALVGYTHYPGLHGVVEEALHPVAQDRVQVGEDEERDDQQQQWADGGMGMQQVLDALHRGLAPASELLGGGVGRCGRGCVRTCGGGWCHGFLLAVVQAWPG